MDLDTGQIKFFENQRKLEEAKKKNPKLKEVIMTKDSICSKCPAYKATSEGDVCTGGNRRERREKYNCRVKKIVF